MEKSNSVLFPFLCDDCGWSYETNDKLQKHIQQDHMVEYSCSQPVDSDNGELGLSGEHQRLRLHIKRSFVNAISRSTEIDPEISSGTTVQKESQEKRDRAVCRKCNISFFSKLLFERHIKGHVHESELAVKVRRIQIPDEVLRDVSNSYSNQASINEATEAEFRQDDAESDNFRYADAFTSNVEECLSVPVLSSSLTTPIIQNASNNHISSSMESMETPMSSELLSRSLLDELSGYMKDVTESILTSPQKGMDNNFDQMAVVDPPSKSVSSSVGGINNSVPLPNPKDFHPSQTRVYSQPPTFPRVCSSPTENKERFSPSQTSTRPRSAGMHNPPNPRLSAILQLPNVLNRPSPPPLASITHTQTGTNFLISTTASSSPFGSSVPTVSSSYYGNSVPSPNSPAINTSSSFVHCSGGTASSLVARSSPHAKCHAVSTPPSAVSLHGIQPGAGSSQALTTMAPSQTDTRLAAILAGGQAPKQSGQPFNVRSSNAASDRYQSATVISQGQPSQVMQRAGSASSPGTRKTPPSLNSSATGQLNTHSTVPVSAANPLAMLNQMNLSVSRGPATSAETNVSAQERPASVMVLENTQENMVPSIHSVVSLRPGYKHESWGNIVVPTSEVGAQHIHQNPGSHCQCIACRDIRGGDLLRKSQQMDNGRCEYKCPKCKRLFTQKTSFIRHCKTFRHAFICDMCHCGFLTEAPYETHKSLHLLKGLIHSTPQRAPPSLSNRPQIPGSRPIINQQMTPVVQQRHHQGLQVLRPNLPSVLLQHQRKQIMQPMMNNNAPSGIHMNSASKSMVGDVDDDVVVLEPESAMTSTRKHQLKPQYKRTVERSMTVTATANLGSSQQHRTAVSSALSGNRTVLIPQRASEILQQQQSQTTIQPLTATTSSTPSQISRILNNSELTLTPIVRAQDQTPPTSAADIVLRANSNMQLTDNGPQKPVQINVNSAMVGLAQPITATPRKHMLPNILAKRPQQVNTSTSSSPQEKAIIGMQVNSGGATFAIPQSQPSNVYRVVPSGSARSGLKPVDAPSGSFQMNSIHRPNPAGTMPLWHHPVNANGSQPGPSPMPGRQLNQVGGRMLSNSMNLRPQSLPSSHQSHGPNRYPSSLIQSQGSSQVRYAAPMRLPPPPPYSQPPSAVSHAPYSQNRQQVRPALHPMQNVCGMPAPSQPKDRMVKCKICGGIFPTIIALQNHFEQAHANTIHQQQALGISGNNSGNLLFQQLQKLHHPQQSSLQPSQHLGRQQTQQANQLQPAQQSHQMQQIQLIPQHQKQASHACRRCQKTFQSLLQFKSHETLCNEKVPCMKCNVMVFKNELLSHYSKVHHNGNPPFGLENCSQSDGTLSNRISPDNPIFSMSPQTSMTSSPGYQPVAVHPENSSVINADSSQLTTEAPLTGPISLGEFSSQHVFTNDTLHNIAAEPTIEITGFSLNEASDSLVRQMSIAPEPLLPPPPLVKLSSIGLNGNCASEAIHNEGTLASVVSSMSSAVQYFINAEMAQDGVQYPIIQSVHSLSETSGQIPSNSQHETVYEEPLTLVIALLGELVNAVEEECNKDSLLDEASGLFVKVNQDISVCESGDGSNSNSGTIDVSRPSIASEAHVNMDSPRIKPQNVEPYSEVTDSNNTGINEKDNAVFVEKIDDVAWLHEPLSEDSSEKPPTPPEKVVLELGSFVPMGTQLESCEREYPTTEALAMAVTNGNDERNTTAIGMTSEDVQEVNDSEQDELMDDDKTSVVEDKDDRLSTVEVSEGSRDTKHVESAVTSTCIPAMEETNESVKDTDLDDKNESESEKANVQNDSDTDTVALEDDGETSEPTAAEEKPAACPICDLEFDSRKALVEHSHIHLSTREHRCTFCNCTFSTNKLLRSHLRTHLSSCREPPRNCRRKRRRMDELFTSGAPENMAIALFDYDKVTENTEFLRRLGIYGFIRFNDLKDFFCGKRKRPQKPPLINLPDDDDEN